ncbi:MAG: S8 family serine peptidase, partial [Bacteroidota bacterium]
MKRYTTFLVLSSLLFLAWSAFAPAEKNIVLEENWETKISPQLTTKALRGETLDFLVILKNQKDVSEAKHLKSKAAKANYVFSHLRQHARISQKGILKMLNQAQAIYQPFNIVNAIHVKGDYELLKKIAQRTEVQQINDNSPVLLEEPVEKIYTNTRGPNAIEWGLEMINADDVWNMGYKGQHVVVGGQDTGYNWEHPALSAKYRGNQGNTPDHNYNWHDAIREINPLHEDSTLSASNNPCGLDVPFPCDDVGSTHGTHTMGTMVGEDGDNQIGVAPDAQWVACRNMERGYGTPSTYIECFEWFMAPTDLNNENADPTKAPHVIANSWSCPPVEGCDSTNWHVMELVVENLKASGVVVVVSAGNSGGQGCGSVKTPAAMFEPSFSVGATAANDTIADFSSKGAVTINGSGLLKPNVSAPGVLVRSSVKDSSYASYSGTSMAGPHAAGMVALMISANPDLAG